MEWARLTVREPGDGAGRAGWRERVELEWEHGKEGVIALTSSKVYFFPSALIFASGAVLKGRRRWSSRAKFRGGAGGLAVKESAFVTSRALISRRYVDAKRVLL